MSFLKPKRKEPEWHDTYDPSEEKFPELGKSEKKDAGWATAYYIHLGIMLILAIIFTVSEKPGTENNDPDVLSGSDYAKIYGGIAVMMVSAGLAAWFWLSCMQRYAKQLIWFCLLLTPAVLIIFTIILWFVLPDDPIKYVVVGFLGLMILISLLVLFCWRHRIPFASALLTTVSGLTKRYPGTSTYSFIFIGIEALYFIIWLFALVQVAQFFPDPQSQEEANTLQFLANVTLYIFLFSAYWTQAVIKYTVHVTICGVFGTWYFVGTDNVGEDPTRNAAKRALGPSFGPICFGAAIIALIRVLKEAARRAMRESDSLAAIIIACIVYCIISCIEQLLDYFNKYAYVQVAIYGKGYIQAAKDTWNLIMSHGIYALINDNLTGNVLALGQLIGGCIVGLIGVVYGLAVYGLEAGTIGPFWVMIFGIMGLFIGFFIVGVVMEVVESGIACIFVCFAMEPERLRDNDNELYKVFYDAHGASLKF